ncbi:DUF305 domain-containing protein [Actinoplanes sp. NPDC051470]|uniref:DUF305 domain-containing protein n=1 Tax=Actinoplanes sp. NPDC051470 TaxID=3157224 RepID=UPI0034200A26
MDRRRWLTLGGVVVALLVTTGAIALARSGGERSASTARPQASHSGPPATVIVPGKPGESAKVTDSDQVAPLDASTYNAVDTAFVQMMIAHHRQAIAMADLAPQRAGNVQVRNLAERMSIAQKIEINVLEAWLEERRLPENNPAHNHATMPGMQTDAAIAALTAARGADFDKRFVTMMTAHHEGARVMAGDVLKGGSDQRVNEIANEMAVEQTSEIRRMRDLKVT